MQVVYPLMFLVIATSLEVSGDAIVRMGLYDYVGPTRLAIIAGGGVLLLGYGTFLNLAPVEFGRVVGLYIATLFVVWQVVTYIAFRSLPTLPILIGGTLIVLGGAIVTFWKPA